MQKREDVNDWIIGTLTFVGILYQSAEMGPSFGGIRGQVQPNIGLTWYLMCSCQLVHFVTFRMLPEGRLEASALMMRWREGFSSLTLLRSTDALFSPELQFPWKSFKMARYLDTGQSMYVNRSNPPIAPGWVGGMVMSSAAVSPHVGEEFRHLEH